MSPVKPGRQTLKLVKCGAPKKSPKDDDGPDGMCRLWEVDQVFNCPVIGACLTLAEQKRLLRKAGLRYKGKSDFEIHEILVAHSDNPNDLSQQADRLLRRKYLDRVSGLIPLGNEEFLREWMLLLEHGELGPAVYAAAVKTPLGLLIKKKIFGLIHMSMHETGAAVARVRFDLKRAEEAARGAWEKQKELTRLNRELKREIKKLQAALEEQRLKAAGERNESLARPVPRFPAKPVEAGPSAEKGDLEMLRTRADELERENRTLRKMLKREKREDTIGTQILQSLLSQAAAPEPCDASCPSYDLCQKRILIVGGITKMANHYRDMVEAQGGRLDYHTGNLKNGLRALESRLKRADLVLCPVDCNSHAACNAVKKLGKKHNKPVRMLHRSSLNAISQALGPEPPEAMRAGCDLAGN